MRSGIFIALFIFSIFCKNVTAQSHLYLDAAQTFSTFKFSSDNTQNNTSPGSGYSTISSVAFGIGYEYVDSSGLLAIAGIGIRKAGSSLVYNKTNYTWNLQYLDLKAGIGYQYNKWRIRPYAAVLPFYATLLNARQTIGLNYYNIKSSNSIKNSDYGLFFTAGFNVPLSHFIAIYFDYNYILGLRNIETTASQYLYNRGSSFKLGLLFHIQAIKTNDTPFLEVNPGLQPTQYQKTDSLKATKDIQISANNPQNTITPTNSTSLQNGDTTIDVNNKKNTIKQDTLPALKEIKNNQNDTLPSSGNTEKLNEKQLQDISKIAVKQNIIFKIQVAAVKKELNSNHTLLKALTGPVTKEKSEDGFIRYFSGSFKTYEKARFELDRIKSNEISQDAFIVAFKNGKKITINDAKNILE